MIIKSLNGKWNLKLPDSQKEIQAIVPGWNFTDLRDAGVIEDPYWRDNATRLRWVQDKDWHYYRDFDIPASYLRHEMILLRCHGLDTFCEIAINGRPFAKTNNMFRTWEFDAKQFLKPGKNRIDVLFRSVIPYINKKYHEHPLYQWGEKDPKRTPHYAYIRKAPYQFGWDWSPSLVGYGIWKKIELAAFDSARISEVYTSQSHSAGAVRLSVGGTIETIRKSEFRIRATLSLDEKEVAAAESAVKNKKFGLVLKISHPQLWWPNGLGERPLYELRTELLDPSGRSIETDLKRIGFRTVRLIEKKDKIGCSFYFEVNGIPVWGRGANWVPADCFPPSISRERYHRLIEEMAAQNMNILRVWGGGLYESDDFYDACDEQGVLVWQDFIFACGTYPSYDRVYMENVRFEAEENVRRIRHHASLCLWCGNNEIEEGLVGSDPKKQMSVEDYNRLFDKLLPSVVKKLDPATPYIRSSGRAPGARRDVVMARDVNNGDSHLWWVMSGLTDVVRRINPVKLAKLKGEKLLWAKYDIVWGVHNGLNKYEQRKILPRFASELGRQSFPVMKTIRSFTAPGDRNPLHPVMEFHQMGGNAWMLREITDRFMPPERFEDTVRLTQIVQGEKFRWYVENWRRHRPISMGALHWTCNDCWPSPEWSTIDYYLRRKASFYIFKRFYSPVLVTGEEDPNKFTCAVHVVNDDRKNHHGTLRWAVTDLDGRKLASGTKKAMAASCADTKINLIDVRCFIKSNGKENLLIWLDWIEKGKTLSSNLVTFCEFKSMILKSSDLKVSIKKIGATEFEVEVSTDRPAFWVWFETPDDKTDWSDNYFHLRPGISKKVTVKVSRPMPLAKFKKTFKSGSLKDFY